MTHTLDPHHSARHIRRRLFTLLMQAFGTVVLLTVLMLAITIVFVVSQALEGGVGFMPDQGRQAEAYYLGRGSWLGVEALVSKESGISEFGWERMILLDEEGRVLLDGGKIGTSRVGQLYPPDARAPRFSLVAGGEQIGALVIERSSFGPPLGVLGGLALPVGIISFFTGVLTLLIGFMLVRRVVTPLADVIAAAHAVADGDLTTRVQVRGPGDLRGLSDSFNRMAGSLERNDRERRDLLADIAHELRTPLTVMRGKLEGIVDGVYPADESHIAPVLEETYLLERLVEDLRLLTLAESGQLHFDRQQVDLGELAQQAADLFTAEASEKGVAITVEAASDLQTVSADPQRLSQVIGNLVSNALRYVPEGGRVAITARSVAGGVELAVSDNGPGVPEADLPRLFDRFWRGEKSRSRAAGGAGLGLAIARQLVETQGGAIAASNIPGGGLRVAFILQ
jgi:two-component system OmpR family sensor kinase/two-component system sensor histidine kinase BaeS